MARLPPPTPERQRSTGKMRPEHLTVPRLGVSLPNSLQLPQYVWRDRKSFTTAFCGEPLDPFQCVLQLGHQMKLSPLLMLPNLTAARYDLIVPGARPSWYNLLTNSNRVASVAGKATLPPSAQNFPYLRSPDSYTLLVEGATPASRSSQTVGTRLPTSSPASGAVADPPVGGGLAMGSDWLLLPAKEINPRYFGRLHQPKS